MNIDRITKALGKPCVGAVLQDIHLGLLPVQQWTVSDGYRPIRPLSPENFASWFDAERLKDIHRISGFMSKQGKEE